MLLTALDCGSQRFGLATSPLTELDNYTLDIGHQQLEARTVGIGANPDDNVGSDVAGEKPSSRQLPQAAFDTVSRHR